jgi:hypothetical protein
MTIFAADRTRGPRIAHVELPSAAASARRARSLLRRTLDGLIPRGVLDTALLLSTELVTNAVATAPTPLLFEAFCGRSDGLRVEVTDTNPDLPTLVNRGLQAETGRGLMLVDALADAWGARPEGPGKVVWFSLRA